jgi:rare lipoprotein A
MTKFLRYREHMLTPVYYMLICFMLFFSGTSYGQKRSPSKQRTARHANKRVIYGLASFYADKFNGRRTASGELFSQRKLTCACNMLPFGTWIKITNLKNRKSVIVKVNDRLHTKMRRLADLSKAAARKIGYMTSGLVRIRVEVIGSRKPA